MATTITAPRFQFVREDDGAILLRREQDNPRDRVDYELTPEEATQLMLDLGRALGWDFDEYLQHFHRAAKG